MKRLFLTGALVLGFLLVSNIVFGDFYVIATKPRLAGTEIKALPYTITAPGFYYLTKNLTSTDDGIIVDVEDVTIDLMGFRIDGPGTSSDTNGIYLKKNYVEIRNGIIRNFENGIAVFGSRQGIQVINIRAIYNDWGIKLDSSRGCRVKNCTAAHNNSTGIYLSDASTAAGNMVFFNGGSGIHVSSGATVIDNTAYGNQSDGIFAHYGATVTRNTAYQNTGDGFHIRRGSTVTNNTAYDNGGYGFNLETRNLFWNNTAYENDSGNYNGCSICTIGENYVP